MNSWFNGSEYENIKITDVFEENSLFFEPWKDEKSTDFYLHKLGHFVFYGSLSIFLFWRSSNIKTIFFKLILITGFAFMDEIHQYFVVGRSGRLMDVGFDMFSVFFFLFFVIAFGKVIKKDNSKEKLEKRIFNDIKKTAN